MLVRHRHLDGVDCWHHFQSVLLSHVQRILNRRRRSSTVQVARKVSQNALLHQLEALVVVDLRDLAILPVAIDDGAENAIALVWKRAVFVIDEVNKRTLSRLENMKSSDTTDDGWVIL